MPKHYQLTDAEVALVKAARTGRAARSFWVDWSDGDMEWVGRCQQYPSMSWLSATEAGAMVGILALVAQVDRDAWEEGNGG